ncbi:hypothetical protein D3C86_1159840 [compost metagenome]
MHLVSRVILFYLDDKTVFTGLNSRVGTQMFIGVQVNSSCFGHQLFEDRRELLQPVNGFDAGCFKSLFFIQFCAFPNCNVFICFTQEKDFTVCFIACIRK